MLKLYDEFVDGLTERIRYEQVGCYQEYRRNKDARPIQAKILEDRETANARMDGGRYNE